MEDILRTSPGICLEDVSWKTPGGRLKKRVVATSISDQSRTSLRPKLRRFYDVSVSAGMYVCMQLTTSI